MVVALAHRPLPIHRKSLAEPFEGAWIQAAATAMIARDVWELRNHSYTAPLTRLIEERKMSPNAELVCPGVSVFSRRAGAAGTYDHAEDIWCRPPESAAAGQRDDRVHQRLHYRSAAKPLMRPGTVANRQAEQVGDEAETRTTEERDQIDYRHSRRTTPYLAPDSDHNQKSVCNEIDDRNQKLQSRCPPDEGETRNNVRVDEILESDVQTPRREGAKNPIAAIYEEPSTHETCENK